VSLDATLLQLEAAELVRTANEPDAEGGSAFRFKHALVQDTIYASLLKHDRKQLHQLVAAALEHEYQSNLDPIAARLAQHYSEAGEDAKTLEYALRAAEVAGRVYANAEAILYLTQAIEIASRNELDSALLQQLFVKRGRALELMNQYDRALANYDELYDLAHARTDRAMELGAQMARATIFSTPNAQFNPTFAADLSNRSLALARELNDRASEARILWNLMLLYHFTGHPTDAIVYGEQAVALAREMNLRERLAYALNDVSRPYFTTGQPERAFNALIEAQALWRELDNKPMLADNLNTLGTGVSNVGEQDRGLALLAEAYGVADAIGNIWAMSHSRMTTGIIYMERGQIEQALAAMAEGLSLARRAGFQIGIVTIKTALALMYTSMGDLPRGIQTLEADPFAHERERAWEAHSLGVLAQLYVRQGDLVHARELVQSSYAAMERGSANPFAMGTSLIADAELALAERDFARALVLVDKLFATPGQGRIRSIYVNTLSIQGRALLGHGRIEEALEVLRKAREEAERVGSRRFLWRILGLLSEIETQRGNPTKAAEYKTQAREIVEFIAAHTPTEYRQSFLDLPDVRAVFA
jgi:tetratricopeptide (TPR) repeat protein